MQNLAQYEEHIDFIAASTGEAPNDIKASLKDIENNVPNGIPDHADFWLNSRISIPTVAACAAIAPAALRTRQAIVIQLGRIFDDLKKRGLQRWNPKVASALMTANAVEVVAISGLELQVIDSDHRGNLMIPLGRYNDYSLQDVNSKRWTLGRGCMGKGDGSDIRNRSMISLLSHEGDVLPEVTALIKALSSIRDPLTGVSTRHQASLDELLPSYFSAALAMEPYQIRAFLTTYEGFCRQLPPTTNEHALQPISMLDGTRLPEQDWTVRGTDALVAAAYEGCEAVVKQIIQR